MDSDTLERSISNPPATTRSDQRWRSQHSAAVRDTLPAARCNHRATRNYSREPSRLLLRPMQSRREGGLGVPSGLPPCHWQTGTPRLSGGNPPPLHWHSRDHVAGGMALRRPRKVSGRRSEISRGIRGPPGGQGTREGNGDEDIASRTAAERQPVSLSPVAEGLRARKWVHCSPVYGGHAPAQAC